MPLRRGPPLEANGPPRGLKRGQAAAVKKMAAAIRAAERRGHALAYRSDGWSYAQIGDALGVCTQRAYQLVQEGLKLLVTEPAEDVRTLALMRLDDMLVAVYEAALAGDHQAIGTVLKIEERRAKMLGLDAPTKSLSGRLPSGPIRIEIAARREPQDIAAMAAVGAAPPMLAS